ncbi:hypothetical protein [Eikenella corrodens]|uniref:hypothetical protein n=1 Tax=Eikenella corrodens TaxID=539 RepID=UPI0018C87477|nr:hypothetical protein [Eikenella corrodens]
MGKTPRLPPQYRLPENPHSFSGSLRQLGSRKLRSIGLIPACLHNPRLPESNVFRSQG